MRIIYQSDDQANSYESIYVRKASRAIILNGNQILLIQSKRFGEYKFPGGGIKSNETKIEGLIREVLEESGRKVIPFSIKSYGKTIEKHESYLHDNQLFIQVSYYYTLSVFDEVYNTHLDSYEEEFGYEASFVDISKAIFTNERIIKEKDISQIAWVKRELAVLKKIKKEMVKQK